MAEMEKKEMEKREMEITAEDWDISEDFYRENDEKKELKLEDFMSPEDETVFSVNGDYEVERTAEHVRQVMKLSDEGKTIGEIAAALGLEEEYVYRIQICALGDGDPVSVAHLVLMGRIREDMR